MKPVDLSSLTLADLEGTVALDAIETAANIMGVPPEQILADVSAEPLTLDEVTVGLQCRADRLLDSFYGDQPGLFSSAGAGA